MHSSTDTDVKSMRELPSLQLTSFSEASCAPGVQSDRPVLHKHTFRETFPMQETKPNPMKALHSI